MPAEIKSKNVSTRAAPNASDRTRLRLKAWWGQIVRAWFSIQLTSYGGEYSIERMLALDEYTRSTPLWRVLLVIFATPVPMVLFVIAQELIPLQDPVEGWEANYVLDPCVSIGRRRGVHLGDTCCHLHRRSGPFCTTTRHLLHRCLGPERGSRYGDLSLLDIHDPVFTISLSMVQIFILVLVFRAIVGGRAFREMGAHKEQLIEYANFQAVNIVMVATYPAFQVLFQATADSKWEQPTILLLPVIKLVMKCIYTRIYKTKEDMLPEEVTFSVIFFDALYLATCMQSIRSLKTVMLIMAVDVSETAIELRELHRRTREIRARLQLLTGYSTADLLSAVRSLCDRVQNVAQERTSCDIRLRSCINSHKISHPSSLLMHKLDALAVPVDTVQRHPAPVAAPTTAVLIPMSKPTWSQRALRRSEVQPMTTAHPVGPIWTPSGIQGARQPVDDVATLQEALEALFTAECLVLAEYVETFIPFLYANYILVMVHLPSAKYHQEMQGLTAENVGGTVESVYLYGLLELVSFVALAVIMRRNCGIQALYHLGFVLETQTALVQSKMLIWAMMTLTYRVVHFGKFVHHCARLLEDILTSCSYCRCRLFLPVCVDQSRKSALEQTDITLSSSTQSSV
jgi:hypothetical protein